MQAPPPATVNSASTTPSSTQLLTEKHQSYIQGLNKKKDDFEYWVTEHLRVSGFYWGLTAMDLMNALPQGEEKEQVIKFLLACQNNDGGFGGNIDHDSHLLYTLSALQVLALYDALDQIKKEACIKWIASLQRDDGSFAGDEWGEIDTRFSYIGLLSLTLLGRPDAVNIKKAAEFVGRCKNFDGGFGNAPGAESHAGQVFCCVAALALAGAVKEYVDADLLGWWLAERQTKDGGLNGRPEKLADVCYSWWVLSSLHIIGRLDWIDRAKLSSFIFSCQDPDGGGIADKPGNVVDVYHTFFGIAGLSLMGYAGLKSVDPVYALPVDVVKRLGLRKEK